MLEQLKRLLDISDASQDALLSVLLAQAEQLVLGYTWRKALLPAMETAVVQLALIAYNRMGAEGESARSEGGVSRTFVDGIPSDIKAQLGGFIRAKVVGT